MLKQIIIVNNGLGMSKGKIVAQVAHGTTVYVKNALKAAMCFATRKEECMLADFNEWEESGMTKIILKSSLEEIERLSLKMKTLDIWQYKVHDFGRTQVAPNSITCLIIEPIREHDSDAYFSHLGLL